MADNKHTAPPCCIGSDHLNGISKLVEEMGELQTVIGKAMAIGSFGEHWSHENLARWAEEEMGDVIAAIYFVAHNNDLCSHSIEARATRKRQLFCQWDAEQSTDHDGQLKT